VTAVQFPLRMTRVAQPVDVQTIATLDTLGAACSKCAEWSGLSDKAVCIETGMDPGQWSRIKTDQAHPSGEFLLKLMDACGNESPLIWLVCRRGYDPATMRRLESDLERQLREQREKNEGLTRELETIKKFLKETGRA
jgi:hypothetical protein